MNKLDVRASALTRAIKSRSEVPAVRPFSVSPSLEQHRLLVLIPADVDYSILTRQICELSKSTSSRVQLLGLCKDSAEEPGLRRSLATLCALIQAGGVSSEAKVESGASWVDVIKRKQEQGDLLVCLAGQRTGMLQRPLSQILQSSLDVQIYIVSGANAQSLPRPNWLSRIMAWAGSLGIIVSSFLLQIRITSLPQDWVQTVLIISSVAGEIWLIWAWNNLVG